MQISLSTIPAHQKKLKQTFLDHSIVKINVHSGISGYCFSSVVFFKVTGIQRYERTIQLPEIVYYGRYVDDIIAIFVPQNKVIKDFYLQKIKQIVASQELQLNSDPKKKKSYQVDAYNSTASASITFLGYRFEILNKRYAGIFLSDNKINKYSQRLEAIFTVFLKDKTYNYHDAKQLLIHRLNYLTKNTQLIQPKKGRIGIYYSNSLLEPTSSCLDKLNSILIKTINKHLPHPTYPELNDRLSRFCFKKGFVNKLFFNIDSKKKTMPDPRSTRLKTLKPKFNNFEKIVSTWKL